MTITALTELSYDGPELLRLFREKKLELWELSPHQQRALHDAHYQEALKKQLPMETLPPIPASNGETERERLRRILRHLDQGFLEWGELHPSDLAALSTLEH